MQTVDLTEHLANIESLKKQFSDKGLTHKVPDKRIIKDHLGNNNYRVLLCTFNEPSFQGEYIYQITSERLAEQMDKLVGGVIGEVDQRDCRKRISKVDNVTEFNTALIMIDLNRRCGTLLSYEIVEDIPTGIIELFGVVNLSEMGVDLVNALPHYLSIRCIGDQVRSHKKPTDFRVKNIGAFDLEPAFFN